MSGTPAAQITEVPDEAAARSRTMQIVTEALRRAATEIQGRGGPDLSLVGLWHASISCLLLNAEIDYVLDLLEDACARLTPDPKAVVDPAAEDERLRRITEIGLVICNELEAAHERCLSEGLEDSFPKCVLDKAITTLYPRWGSEHLKAAMASQAVLLATGVGAVYPAREPAHAAPPQPLAASDHRQGWPRAAVVRVEVDISGKVPLWAFASTITAIDGSGREEMRDVRCPMPGANLARALMAGVLAALNSIASEGPGASILIETSHEPFLAQASSLSSRPWPDGAVWQRVERMRETMQIEFRKAHPAQHQEVATRCLKLLGRIS